MSDDFDIDEYREAQAIHEIDGSNLKPDACVACGDGGEWRMADETWLCADCYWNSPAQQ